ncbi:MAG: cytochrome P450 [Parvularculaceae bacterium]|nr:cytochrome P450 [Parvularculaceae bacterium]
MSAVSQSAAKEPLLIDSEAAYNNPHAYMKSLREKSAVAITDIGVFVVLKHKYMDALLDNENTRQFELEGMMLRGITSGPLFELYKNAMLFANGDVHKRRRSPMARTFAYKLMDGMRPRVREIAAEVIEANRGKGPVNFLDAFSRAIPARIIAEIIGAPPEDWPKFSGWVADAARGIGFFQNDELPQIDAGVGALDDYVKSLLDERRKNPREDFLTSYAQATAASGELTEEEIRMQMAGVILAGSDTTRTGTAAVLSELLQHPDQWALVCADPEAWKKPAVEEGLRFDPPVGSVPRFTLREMEIEGVVIPEGRVVSMSVLSGLRDPDVYPEPDRFDIRRTGIPKWNIAFGGGAHRCLGEALARAEMEESIATIARLAPDIKMIGDPPKIRGTAAIRHIDAMTVEFH